MNKPPPNLPDEFPEKAIGVVKVIGWVE